MFDHLKIPLEEVVKATNNFDEKYVIGEGSFGKVYRGQLWLSQKVYRGKFLIPGKMVNIAARRLDRKHGQGDIEFWTEISVLSRLEHENLVILIGFCDENGEKIIINSHEAKGSLLTYLSDPTLTWIQRLKIGVGVARALRYIHNGEGRGYTIVHRNINSSTVLLDDNWEAKLSGFEFCIKQSVTRKDCIFLSEPIFTPGYLDPEIEKTGGVTHKSDIYSFGVVLCEILCGRKAFIPDADDRFLAPLVRFHYEQRSLNDIIHPDLRNQVAQQSLISFSKAAYSCLKEDRVQRPNINDLVIELKNALEVQQRLENLRKNLERLKIPLGDIMLATDNFSKEYQIRDTGYYKLYRAELEHNDIENPSIKEEKNKGELSRRRITVVIKRILPREDYVVEKEFYTEIEVLNTCKHPSIVRLLGFCDEGSELILVVEHLSKGYLADYWKNLNDMPILTWAKRLKICLDVAHALNYLHTEMEDQMMIIHSDIRSAYIALDENWGAKIVDFAHSVFLPLNQVEHTRHLSPYYRDPVYWKTGELKRESDVYSFGIVMFEVLCGKLADDPIYRKESDELGLAFVVRRCFKEGTLMELLDPVLKEERVENNFSLNRGPNEDSLEKFVRIAHVCIAESQDQRPTMKMVIKELQKVLFFQEQIQEPDMVQDVHEVEKPIHFELPHENYEERIHFFDIVQVADELTKLMGELQQVDEVQKPHDNYRKKLEHLKIPLSDIKSATANFSEVYHIDDTGYYNLYRAEFDHFDKENLPKEGKNKGELPRRRNTLVIKRIYTTEKDGERGFDTEIQILATCKHPNIIKLIGFCDEGSEMILVIEHLFNGYLADYWRSTNMRHTLTWAKRLKICLDVANALDYIHSKMQDQKMIINRDIKSHHIMLDENWGAKIIEFGLSVFLNKDDDALYDSFISGTPYYIDPEYAGTGKLKRESDVYSFGVVLFEVLCGKLANDPIYRKESDKLGLAYVARRCVQEGTLMELMDPLLKEEQSENIFTLNRGPNKHSLEIFVKIAHECIAETQDQRPTMKVVIKELQEAIFFQKNNNDYPMILLEEIKLATQNFHDDNCVGRGGFGKVYKGKLRQGESYNTIVAKRLDKRLGQGEQQFRNELQILVEYKHEKLIGLVGYCGEKNEKIIVYEYASQGSLDRYLKDARLTWMKRLKICNDVATALDFLHGGAGKQAIVIHRDIKAANILLNDEWDARLADFGLSLISPINPETDHVIDHVCGTQGYLDPLYLKSGFLTIESDIYSFGVVLFEILCGRSTFEIRKQKGQYLPGFIKESFEKGKHHELVFEAIKEQITPKALTAFQMIAFRCLHDDRKNRPTAKEVLQQLKEAHAFQSFQMKKVEDLNIPLSDILLATDNFSNSYQIGATSISKLYRAELEHFDKDIFSSIEGKNKGELPKRRGTTVVIKRILPREDRIGEKVFITEFEMLTSCRHPNIVTLLGYCDEGSELILVIEHLSKGFLSDYWSSMPILTWEKRLKICLDVAHALNYLHSEMEDQKRVIHHDIRSNNIAMDKNWRAKIVNFALSVFLPPNQDNDTLHLDTIFGSYTYIDPEYRKTGKLKRESDVYNFGVVLFEVLCGRLSDDPIYLQERDGVGLAFVARRCFQEGTLMGMIDPKLKKESSEECYFLNRGPNKDSLDKFVKIALQCVAETQDQRPTMKVVIQELEKALFFEENKEDLKIPLQYIILATENFHDNNCIGGGGFWKVYKGKVPYGDGFSNIVAKRLDTRLGQGEQQFRNELQILLVYEHKKLIRFVGYCDEKNEQIIVYEYASQGSLDRYLKDARLTWMKRLKICIDVASALAFLHGGAGNQATLIHRDIKTASILLNDKWDAKLADFGLSLISSINQETDLVIDLACGSKGYLDPLYLESGFLTIESDIYSFGVVLFEILCGRSTFEILKHKGQYLPDFIKESFEKGKHDDLVFEALKEEIVPKALNAFQMIAYRCLHDDRKNRPTAKEVLQQLKEAHAFQSFEMKFQMKKVEHLNIPLSDILLATDNFSNAYQIGATSISKLYRAELEHFDKDIFSSIEGKNKGEPPKRRSTVVIKRILPREDQIGEKVFATEFEMLTSCRHPNIVTLLGYCNEGSELILVIEHLSNGFLSDYWSGMPILKWEKRLKICLDVAHALNYLHNEMEDQKRVIHHDIRSNNIALDENWGAKIVNFALSVFLPPNQDYDTLHLDTIFGLYTYIDPEYRKTGKLKRESDVYNFGVVMFETLCGRLSDDPIYLKERDGVGLAFVARRCFQEGILTEMIDPVLKKESSEECYFLNRGPNKDSLDKFVKIALHCVAETQDQRPTMKVVIQELQKALFFEENKDDLIISLQYIKQATENFHDNNCIGGGGFWKVYKGKLVHGDECSTIVAKRVDTRLGQGEQQFRNELQILSEYKHENLIRLIGYCVEKNEQIIVYEYASQGSLDRYLKDARLTWLKRLKICIDVASALAFLHGGAGKQATVIHRDIKTANVLLNDEWDAKLSDFRLSLISPINPEADYVIDHVCGTRGYLDPVYLKSGFLTIESDMYSFGVVLFEILCGRSTFEICKQKGQFLTGYIEESFEKGKHDDLVFDAIKEQIVPKALSAFQTIAYQCLHDDREKRPTAKEVLKQLKEALEFQISGTD